jgi:hypothetical protein
MITLLEIKQKQDEIGAMIAAFESYKDEKISFPAITLSLEPGEKNAGLILGKDGETDYFLILLPDTATDINWNDAVKWAKKLNSKHETSLPNRREQSLLFANLKDDFEERAYWSSEQHASNSVCAWCQHFVIGSQNHWHKGLQLQARAVRRILVIQ